MKFHFSRTAVRAFLALSLLCLAGLLLWTGPASRPVLAGAAAVKPEPHRIDFATLPMIFEQNQGQSDSRVKFLARGQNYGLFLTPAEAVLSLRSSHTQASSPSDVIRMSLVGANATPRISGDSLLSGKSHYLIGSDRNRWVRDVPQYGRVRYDNVYPGIDLVYYGKQGQLEYDFEVAPGADPRQISVALQSSSAPVLASNGDLVLTSESGKVRLQAPQVYQKDGDRVIDIPARFSMQDGRVGFSLGSYDRRRALVIDPVLSYSSYLGGSGNESCSAILSTSVPPANCPAIAIDGSFNIYVAGSTTSTDFPAPSGGTSPSLNGVANVFIAKLDPTGKTLLFSTILGGSGTDTTAGLGTDSGFNVYVGGTTNSSDFPAVNGYQSGAPVSGNHVFVAKVDSTGSNILYSTYLAGNGIDTATGFTVDFSGKEYVTGTSTSPAFPTSGGFPTTSGAIQTTPLAANAFFVSKVDPTLTGNSSLAYSTYFGGGNPSNGTAVGGGIAVDTSNDVYFTGTTNFLHVGNASTDFPIVDAYQPCLDTQANPPPSPCPTATATDAFIAKLNPAAASGAQLLYSTYFGGSGADTGTGIAVDTSFAAYLTGSTASSDIALPSGITPFQSTLAGGIDAFAAKVGGTLDTTTNIYPLNYFSYLGGSGTDVGLAMAVDTSGGARIAGYTNSTNFHLQAPVQSGPGGAQDAFFARIDTTATTADASGHYSSYLGGGGNDFGTSIAADSQTSSYIAGETASSNFPVASPFQSTKKGTTDAFVSKVTPSTNLAITGAVTPSPVGIGNQVTFTFTITNNGDLVSGVTVTDFLPASGATFTSATSSGTCGGASGGTVVCNIGTLNAGATATVTVILVPTVGGSLSDSASVQANGSAPVFVNPAPVATVNTFTMAVAPATQTVTAGVPAAFTVTLTPTGTIPNTISLSCSSGLPSGGSCTFSSNPILFINNSAVTSSLAVNTTVRTITTADAHTRMPLYAAWFPLSGLAFLGLGLPGGSPRRRKLMIALLILMVVGAAAFQVGCSGSSGSQTTVTGTPAGTYTVNVTATSGTYTQTVPVTLIVQ